MSQPAGTIEYVVNPITHRLMRKDGRAHKRWRKANPLAPEPRTLQLHMPPTQCPNHRAPSTSRRKRSASAPPRMGPPKPRKAPRKAPGDVLIPPPPPPPSPILPSTQEAFNANCMDDPLSPPPLRRCNAWTEQMFQGAFSPTLETVEEEPPATPHEHNDGAVRARTTTQTCLCKE